jgi:hypothetical protein
MGWEIMPIVGHLKQGGGVTKNALEVHMLDRYSGKDSSRSRKK